MVGGQTVIPRGAHAEGTVIDARALGHFKGGALLELRLERVKTNWGSYPVATSTMERAEKGKGKRTAAFGGGERRLARLWGHWQAAARVLPLGHWREEAREPRAAP